MCFFNRPGCCRYNHLLSLATAVALLHTLNLLQYFIPGFLSLPLS
uniref:Uncharacterized protein n=1 Tax=Arundo donax TaxID=35708 RepID=A0A0A8YFA8_ARUDO